MNKIQFGSASGTMRIAGPVIMENLMASAVLIINTAMVGALGSLATAAVGVNLTPLWLINSIPTGLCVGCTVMVARNIGAGDKEKANDVVSQSLGGIILLALIISLLLYIYSPYVPALLNVDPIIWDDAGKYLRIISLSIIPNYIALACSGMLRGAGNTKTPMYVALLAGFITIFLNFFLIYEPLQVYLFNIGFTIPRAGIGVFGAAISTVIAQTVFCVLMIIILSGFKQKIRINFRKIFLIKWSTIRPILKVGIPAMIERITISAGQLMFGTTINSLGQQVSSAHHIAVQAESFSYMPAFGISVAATTLVGQSLGRKDKSTAQGYANTSLLMGLGIGVISMVVIVLFADKIMGLFINDDVVIKNGAEALRAFAPVIPMFTLLNIINGILRGGGDTIFALYAGLVGMWGIRIGLAYYMVHGLGLGLRGAWYAMAIDIIARFTIMLIRYSRKKWLNVDEI